MKKTPLAFFTFGLLANLTAQTVPAPEAPSGFGQLETAPIEIPGGIDEDGRKFRYNGQPAKNGKIILTASNGFFTKGVCKAAGQSKLPKVGDEQLIVPNFAHLEGWKKTDGTLRWHFHIAKPGPVRFQTHLAVEGNASGSRVEFQFAGETQTLTTAASDGAAPQRWDVVFNVREVGEYCLALRADKIANSSAGVGKLSRIDAFGPAIEGAHLLRVRWRPAAVHGGYESPKAGNSNLLVMTTRSTQPVTSYSPVTTPFGYYGTSFGSDQRSNGSFNFSMWGKSDAASDLKQMPHLLAVGSPEGEFSGFGHEGSGVKPRGWTPMPDRPELCVQALRVERGETYDTYFGYYFDHPSNAWKLFGAGNKWHGGKRKPNLRVGSFCEVPGPPHVERTGDVYREVRRQGWYFGGNNAWIPIEKFKAGGKQGLFLNKRWFTSEDGEFAMGCGGIRLYEFVPPEAPKETTSLPYFLKSPSVKHLFGLPIEIKNISVSKASDTAATIDFEVQSDTPLSEGEVYFGTRDALTFAPRKLHGTEKKSELSQSVNNRAWQQSKAVSSIQTGKNSVQLTDLKPGTTYFFRILLNNEVSRVWSNETFKFTTSG